MAGTGYSRSGHIFCFTLLSDGFLGYVHRCSLAEPLDFDADLPVFACDVPVDGKADLFWGIEVESGVEPVAFARDDPAVTAEYVIDVSVAIDVLNEHSADSCVGAEADRL